MKKFKENVVFLMVAHAVFLTAPTIVYAESSGFNPINFTHPLSVSRGKIIQSGQDGFYLSDDETCDILVSRMGWDRSGCDNIDKIIFMYNANIDSVQFSKPVSDGYVDVSDWGVGNFDEEVKNITDNYINSVKTQGNRLNEKITFDGWLVYPTLDQERNALYYANIFSWDGDRVININISLPDRGGFVPISIVPVNSNLSEVEVKRAVYDVLDGYQPDQGQSYSEWTSGDKVATYGAVGVFAGMLGVKYGKAAAAGIAAIALMLLKKAWFLLLLPFIALKKLFTRKS